MKFLQQHKYLDCLMSKYYTTLSTVILILLAIAALIHHYNFYFILITENSILYIYSLIPQIIIGLLAFTLVALPYQSNLLDNKVIQDEEWIDAVNKAKNFFFHHFIAIFLIGISVIFFSMISLGSFNYLKIQDYSLTLSTSGFLIFIGYFIYLITYSFDPNRLKKIETKFIIQLNKTTEEAITPQTQKVETKGFENFDTGNSHIETLDPEEGINLFIKSFSLLEQKLHSFHKERFPSTKQTPPLFNVIQRLTVSGLLSIEQASKINQIRMFRNALIHRDPKQVVKPELLKQYTRILETVLAELKS